MRYIENGLNTLGNVTYKTSGIQNITVEYTDTESRLKAYRTEEERLLVMLEKAETVEDMLNIEDRLSLRCATASESLTSTLMNWDSLISYSTVTLQITEVSRITPITRPCSGHIGRKIDGCVQRFSGGHCQLL